MIEILKYTEVNKGPILAKLDIKVIKWGNFIIREITIFQKENRKWLSLPQKTYPDAQTGETKYYSLNLFEEKTTMEKFQEQVFKALSLHLSKESDEPVTRISGEVPF